MYTADVSKYTALYLESSCVIERFVRNFFPYLRVLTIFNQISDSYKQRTHYFLHQNFAINADFQVISANVQFQHDRCVSGAHDMLEKHTLEDLEMLGSSLTVLATEFVLFKDHFCFSHPLLHPSIMIIIIISQHECLTQNPYLPSHSAA
jgi:hypothetical protein